MGWVRDETDSHRGRSLLISGAAFLGAAVVASMRHDGALERDPAAVPA